jgi:hypothetical protein
MILLSTYAFVAAILLTLLAIAINTYRNAAPVRPMTRLLHDPETRRWPGGPRDGR